MRFIWLAMSIGFPVGVAYFLEERERLGMAAAGAPAGGGYGGAMADGGGGSALEAVNLLDFFIVLSAFASEIVFICFTIVTFARHHAELARKKNRQLKEEWNEDLKKYRQDFYQDALDAFNAQAGIAGKAKEDGEDDGAGEKRDAKADGADEGKDAPAT